MLTRCIVFIYTPDTKEMTSLMEIYVAGGYITKNWRYYICEQITRKLLGAAIIQMGYNCLYFLSGELCWLLWKFYTSSRAISENKYYPCDIKFQIKGDGVYILRRDNYFLEQLNSLTDILSEPNLIV